MKSACDPLRIARYCDGELPEKERDCMREHVARCSACRRECARVEEIRALACSVPRVTVTEGCDRAFSDRLDARLKSQKTSLYDTLASRMKDNALLFPFRRPLLAGVTAALLLAGISFLYLTHAGVSPPEIAMVQGQMSMVRSGNGYERALEPGMKLREGDAIHIGPQSQADLMFGNALGMRLKAYSSFIIEKTPSFFDRRIEVMLERGVCLGSTFGEKNAVQCAIITPISRADITGTAFLVRSIDERYSVVGVREGSVRVSTLDGNNGVTVRGGQQSEVARSGAPSPTHDITREYARLLYETSYIGKPSSIISRADELQKIKGDEVVMSLVLGDIAYSWNRVRHILEPYGFAINDAAPKEVQDLVAAAVRLSEEGRIEGDTSKIHTSIDMYEKIINDYPNANYNPQFLTFIGTYYSLLEDYESAITSFACVAERYPSSELASIAQCAIGILYEEKIKNAAKAYDAYWAVLSNYPESPEAREAQRGIRRLNEKG